MSAPGEQAFEQQPMESEVQKTAAEQKAKVAAEERVTAGVGVSEAPVTAFPSSGSGAVGGSGGPSAAATDAPFTATPAGLQPSENAVLDPPPVEN